MELAEAIAKLLRASFNLSTDNIRCTIVPGFRLPAGVDTDDYLRRETVEADTRIGLLTDVSIGSAYVLFELGARWGASKHLVPLLAVGQHPKALVGPLAGLNALSCTEHNPNLFRVGDEEYIASLHAYITDKVSSRAAGIFCTANASDVLIPYLRRLYEKDTAFPAVAPASKYDLARDDRTERGIEFPLHHLDATIGDVVEFVQTTEAQVLRLTDLKIARMAIDRYRKRDAPGTRKVLPKTRGKDI